MTQTTHLAAFMRFQKPFVIHLNSGVRRA